MNLDKDFLSVILTFLSCEGYGLVYVFLPSLPVLLYTPVWPVWLIGTHQLRQVNDLKKYQLKTGFVTLSNKTYFMKCLIVVTNGSVESCKFSHIFIQHLGHMVSHIIQ